MKSKILATLGPSSLNKTTVEDMTAQGIYLFRINLSHTKLNDLEGILKNIQSWTDVPICLDSEGAQVRNQDMISESVHFKKGTQIKIHPQFINGDNLNISFSPEKVYEQLEIDDVIRVDFDAVRLRVIRKEEQYLIAIVENGGFVGSNKAADIKRDINLDALTNKDISAFKIGLKYGIKNFSLSFTNRLTDVEEIRSIIGSKSNLISKIESVNGVLNLGEILPAVDQILIDRGDLSREVTIEKIPFIQRRIISFAKSKDVPVFVATNLLESMIKTNSPTRAEVNDVASTLLMGASGLVLAAETAIGAYPVESINMINSLIKQYERWTPESTFIDILDN
jgi:pyruvate kinase